MRESTVVDYLRQRIRDLGGETRKVEWVGRRGAPDELVMLPGRHCLVEVKRPRGRPEDHQLREHERLEWAGFTILVIDSKARVDFYFPLN